MRYLWLVLAAVGLASAAGCGHTRIEREPDTTTIRPIPTTAAQGRGLQQFSTPTLRAERERKSSSTLAGTSSGRSAVSGSGRWSIGSRPSDVNGKVVRRPRLRLPGNPERIPGLRPR